MNEELQDGDPVDVGELGYKLYQGFFDAFNEWLDECPDDDFIKHSTIMFAFGLFMEQVATALMTAEGVDEERG